MLLRLALALPVLLPLAPVPGDGDDELGIDFQALGQAFVDAHCGAGATAPCPLEDVLARDFLALDVGPFALFAPRRMVADKDDLARLRSVVDALADGADVWLSWQGVEPDPGRAKLWDRWTKGWKPLKPAALEKLTARELTGVFPPDAEAEAAIETARAMAREGDTLALKTQDGGPMRLILVPTRKEFLQWNGYCGLLDPSLQPTNWRDEAHSWAQLWVGWNLVLALEYAPWTGFDPTFETGQPMEKIGAGVMAQHVVHQGFLGLLRSTRPELPEDRTDGALAMMLTIQTLGEDNTIENAGGVSSSGGSVAPYEQFVPGGNSAGGTLPGRSASALAGLVENRWRNGHGRDAFVAPLKKGQEEGAKAVKKDKDKDPLAHFVLIKEDTSGAHLIHAPFFGPHANDQEYPPEDYLVDYAEFYRAYKTCFLTWIAEHGDPRDPAGKWTELVRGMATLSAEKSFEALVLEVYGVPISARDGSTDSLEWRFLRALPKLK